MMQKKSNMTKNSNQGGPTAMNYRIKRRQFEPVLSHTVIGFMHRLRLSPTIVITCFTESVYEFSAKESNVNGLSRIHLTK